MIIPVETNRQSQREDSRGMTNWIERDRSLPPWHTPAKRFDHCANSILVFRLCLLNLYWGSVDVKVAKWRATGRASNSKSGAMGSSAALSSYARDWLHLLYECSNCATHQRTLTTLSPSQISLMFPLAKRWCGNNLKKMMHQQQVWLELGLISFFITSITLFTSTPLSSWPSKLAATQHTICRLERNNWKTVSS